MKRALSQAAFVFVLTLLIFVTQYDCYAAGSKLIHFGWDIPDSLYLKEHLEEISSSPFDGVVIGIRYWNQDPGRCGGDGLATRYLFQNELDDTSMNLAIADLANIDISPSLTHNFIQALPGPGDPADTYNGYTDWFDTAAWSMVAENFRKVAKVAYESGCEGLFFDIEDYGPGQFKWLNSPVRHLGLAAHEAMARQRGREIMAAINSEFPGINFFCAYGLSLQDYISYPEAYDLQPAFFDGLYEQADTNTIITDGYEISYYSYIEQDFIDARNKILIDARAHCSVPAEFDAHTRVGLATFLDAKSRDRGWNGIVGEWNYYSPQRLRRALYYSLQYNDGISWMYTERSSFWTGRRINPDYYQAVYDARVSAGPDPGVPPPVPSPKLKDGYEEAALSGGDLNIINLNDPDFNYRIGLIVSIGDGRRALMKWDFSAVALPDSTTATEVWIDLGMDYDGSFYGLDPVPVQVKVYRLLRPYNINTVTWNEASWGDAWDSPGASGDGVDRDPVPIAACWAYRKGSLIRLDLLEAYRNWKSGAWANYGMLIVADPEDGQATYKQMNHHGLKIGYDYPPDSAGPLHIEPGFTNTITFDCVPFSYYKIYRSEDGVDWNYLGQVYTTSDIVTYIDTKFPNHYFTTPMNKRYYKAQFVE